jgi:hypothetical protein
MASDKAWYWLAAGVLALGLNGAYRDGQFGWAHQFADRSTEIVERAEMRGLGLVTAAEVMLDRNPEAVGRMEGSLGRMQAKMACKRIEMATRRIDIARMQRDLAAAHVDRQLARVQMQLDKVRVIAIDRATHARNCAELSHVVVAGPRVDLSDLPNAQIPDLPEIQVPSAPHDPI